jgi:hypothetical protein
MTEGEKAVIKAFADGDKTKRDAAIAIHRDNLRIYGLMPRDPFFNFMSEIDNPCPDLSLRAKYRKQVKEARVLFIPDAVSTAGEPNG